MNWRHIVGIISLLGTTVFVLNIGTFIHLSLPHQIGYPGEREISLPSCASVPGPKSLPDSLRWQVLKNVLRVLKEAEIPYYLTCGSLLWLVRDCELGDSDLDIAIDASWWRQKENADLLWKSLNSTGMYRPRTFGSVHNFGYQTRWMIQGLQLDVISSDILKGGERWEAIWIHDHVYACVLKANDFVWFQWWGEQVRLPFPLEPALVSMYGSNYTVRTKKTGYFKYFCRCDSSPLGVKTSKSLPGGC